MKTEDYLTHLISERSAIQRVVNRFNGSESSKMKAMIEFEQQRIRMISDEISTVENANPTDLWRRQAELGARLVRMEPQNPFFVEHGLTRSLRRQDFDMASYVLARWKESEGFVTRAAWQVGERLTFSDGHYFKSFYEESGHPLTATDYSASDWIAETTPQ